MFNKKISNLDPFFGNLTTHIAIRFIHPLTKIPNQKNRVMTNTQNANLLTALTPNFYSSFSPSSCLKKV